jgi:hypothetical protein
LALHIVKRKNDSERKGHYPAVGRSARPDLDLVHQLRVWLCVLGIGAHPLCASRAGVQCHTCPPIFPRFVLGSGSTHHASAAPMSSQMVRDAVRRMAAHCGGDPAHFSCGISARKGGLTTAISARVPEEIVYLQSGHGQTRPPVPTWICKTRPSSSPRTRPSGFRRCPRAAPALAPAVASQGPLSDQYISGRFGCDPYGPELAWEQPLSPLAPSH